MTPYQNSSFASPSPCRKSISSRRIFTRTSPRNRDEGCVPIARIST